MKRLFVLLWVICLAGWLPCSGQQRHFIYIQSENKAAFYAKINGEQFNSSPSGYLVIPRLIDSNYILHIGFPDDDWSLLRFTLTVHNKDAGYLLKKRANDKWMLENLQSVEVLLPGEASAPKNGNVDTLDAFTNMLADVVEAPALKQPNKSEDKKEGEAVVPENEREEIIVDSVAYEFKAESKENIPAVPKTEVVPSKGIILLSSHQKGKERRMRFIDRGDEYTDTVELIIDYRKEAKSVRVKAESVKQAVLKTYNEVATEVAAVVKKEEPQAKPAETFVRVCRDSAASADFFRLRKKMAAEENEQVMVLLATKAMKQKCYTSRQVGNLAVLFLEDANRYSFLEAAYEFVFDPEGYSSLESLLSDVSNRSRFHSLINKKND